jgi:hypothetical protein
VVFKPGFPVGFQSILDDCLKAAIEDGRNAQGAFLAFNLGYIHPSDWRWPPFIDLHCHELLCQVKPLSWRRDDLLINARFPSAPVYLG